MSLQRLLEDCDISISNVQQTSRQAFKELGDEEKKTRCQEYLNALWELGEPSTDQEVKDHLKQKDPNYVRPRRWELENKFNLIMECNPRECSITHKIVKTFWFNDKGLELVGVDR